MNNNELIADKIEEVIGRMVFNFESYNPKSSEYLIFHDPLKHTSWFILIFFADYVQLNEGLKNGICYQIFSYLLNELNKVNEILNIERAIFFESGRRPIEKVDIDNLFGKILAKMEGIQKVAGKTNIKICGICGHDFDKHQLLCNLNEDKCAPTNGWMICPEENCNCFQTWDANYKAESNLRKTSKDSGLKRAFNRLFR